MAKIRRVSFNVKPGVEIVGDYYTNTSGRRAVIIVPGFSEHRSCYRALADFLARDFNVLSIDLNSEGDSSGDFDLNQMAEAVDYLQKSLRNDYGMKKIGAVGTSIGGMAIGIAAAKGSLLDCICLLSTAASVQDVAHVPKWFLAALGYLMPQWLLRRIVIFADRKEYEHERWHARHMHGIGSAYRHLLHFGALKISDISKLIRYAANAPRLYDYAEKIRQPALLAYGGNDTHTWLENSLPSKKIQALFLRIGSKKKRIIIVSGADHSFNTHTQPDSCFNQEPKFQFVKEEIRSQFKKYLSN
jgi:alpha-beta hydrolase superfamily lysophospholipase